MLHEEERKERDYSEILISHERWISFVSRDFHNITDNLTSIIIYNIVQHHLSDLTSLFSTFFQVTHAKIMTTIKMKRHLSYDELKSLSRLTDSWKEITMNFITDLSFSKWKKVVYDLILVIVDHYTKMTHYLSIKKTLTVVKLTELFFKKIALKYEILNDIIINKDSLFINAC